MSTWLERLYETGISETPGKACHHDQVLCDPAWVGTSGLGLMFPKPSRFVCQHGDPAPSHSHHMDGTQCEES